MKTKEEFKRFYDEDLFPLIMGLESKRRNIAYKFILSGIVSLFSLFFGISFSLKENSFLPLAAALTISTIIWLIVYNIFFKKYAEEFKSVVIQKIVFFADEGLRYASEGFLPLDSFISSGIFRRTPDKYSGDDLVEGKIGRTQAAFSEIQAYYKTEHVDSNGRVHRSWHLIFKGLFFIADFYKDFKGTTVVLPDTAERIFGDMGKMFQDWNIGRGKVVRLEDPEFEKMFAVYSDDQIQARYILSTSLMNRIVEFRKKAQRPVFLSFSHSKIYAAISCNKPIFEPRIFRTLLDFSAFEEYFADLSLAFGLIEDLNLNNRIWSKE